MIKDQKCFFFYLLIFFLLNLPLRVGSTRLRMFISAGESVEENANLVIRLLIRRPECLGPALRGEGEGLLRAIIDANKVRLIEKRKVIIS